MLDVSLVCSSCGVFVNFVYNCCYSLCVYGLRVANINKYQSAYSVVVQQSQSTERMHKGAILCIHGVMCGSGAVHYWRDSVMRRVRRLYSCDVAMRARVHQRRPCGHRRSIVLLTVIHVYGRYFCFGRSMRIARVTRLTSRAHLLTRRWHTWGTCVAVSTARRVGYRRTLVAREQRQ